MNPVNLEKLQQQTKFHAPRLVFYFIAGVAAARFHGWLLITQNWALPILVGLWAIICILAVMTALSCFYRHSQKLDPIGAGEIRMILFLSTIIIALVVGYALERTHL